MADCGSCIYRDNIDNKLACGYILVTGEPRGCDAANCTKYQKGEPEMAKKQDEFMAQFTKKSRKAGNDMITAKEKEDIKALRDSGMKLKDIAETMGMTLHQVKGAIYKGNTEDKDKNKSESKRTVEPCEDCSCEEQTCDNITELTELSELRKEEAKKLPPIPQVIIDAVIKQISDYNCVIEQAVEEKEEVMEWLRSCGIDYEDARESYKNRQAADGIKLVVPY